ncbi:MAG: hypothetical protein KAR31_13225 [Candidatus Omnitrophica bacterium]|nr:hypothetical protein [Candidatus Omnitrophota bacterium]
MTRKIITLSIIMAILSLSATCALASGSFTKSFKLSVILPASVNMAPRTTDDATRSVSRTDPREVTEKIIVTANNQTVLLRTTVAK